MGKYTASCLKIITCGAADTRENEDLAASETKAASHKRRCGFRKKSVGYRVQNDIVISDPVSAACNKEREVVTTKHFNSDAHSATPEKTQEGDKPKDTFPLSSTIATSEADHAQFADTNTLVIDGNIQESVAVVIQSTIRAYMAQRELLNLKNIVKLQAVVRGHLLRKQAVGTLCCVQAIVKMQALVRVHLAHQSIAKDKQQMYYESSDLLGKGNLRTKTNKKRPPVQILLSNRFAQQLLESTAKTKAMHIRCDPSRTDSTWKWLERWTVITSSDVQGLSVCEDYNGILNDAKSAASGTSEESPAADAPVISSSNSINQLEKPEDGKENMRSESSDTSESFKLDNSTSAPCNILSSSEKVEQDGPQLEDQTSGITLPVHTKTEDIMQEPFHPLSTQKLFQSDAISQSLPESASYETEVENKNSLGMDEDILTAPGKSDEVLAEDLSTKPEVSEEGLESNFSTGFETEHSASVTYKSLNSAVKVEQDNLQLEDQNLRTMQPRHTKSENITQGASGSLSVEQALLSDGTESEGESPQKLNKRETPEGEEKMSALGSRRLANPAFVAAQSKFEQLSSTQNVGMFIEITNQATGDQSKLGDAQSQVNPLVGATDDPLLENSFSYGATIQKASSEYRTELYMSSALDLLNDAEGGEIMDEAGTSGKGNCAASADNTLPGANLNAAVNGLSSDLGVLQPQMNGEDNRRSKADLLVATDPVTEEKRQKEPTTNSDVQNHLENPTDEQGYRPSQEGSPLNHATLLKFNGTSGIAIKRRRDTIATQKLRSHTLWKALPYTPNGDSSGKNRTSRLPERIKIGMRRSSFGAANSDCVDCEPRISSSQSLPNYMQFTESARAKTHGSISPKSSSDVHDKYYSKKRHSLPIANEKQGLSPRLRRSKSQAQQNINGYGTHSPQSYAERRWQI